MKYFQINLLLATGTVFLLVGCSNSPNRTHPDYAPMEAVQQIPPQAVPADGSIYHAAGHNIALFEDLRARQVGDILTVFLAEATDAEKSSDTSLGKDNSFSMPNPVLGGKLRDFSGDNTLEFDIESNSTFDGESASNQSNSLQGSITVTVAKVYPGGNLYIQGEKWIQINQGNEYIRLRGTVRPTDISPNNTILSTQVADARISYSGTGATADVNRMGWLSRFFISPVWPF